jgi:hypothetical protein
MTRIEAVKEEMIRIRQRMKERELSHDLYFTDPYGYAADVEDLRNWANELRELEGAPRQT